MDGEQRMELFAFWRSSATFRVRVALALKGLAAAERLVDVEKGEHREPEFLSINPVGALPALRLADAERPLTQSLAILEYFEETVPEPPLLPKDPLGRARVRSLALLMAADTHPLITPRVRKALTEEGFDAERWRNWQRRWFTAGMQAFEARLASEPDTGRFSHGDAVTIADICLASVRAVMTVFDIEVPDTPTVDRVMRQCLALPAFANADPFKQKGAPAR